MSTASTATAQAPSPKDVALIVQQTVEIPTMPAVAALALKELGDPEVSAAKVARIISGDQGLTAKILRVANSALYGVTREVRSIQQAAMLIGFRELRSIVVSVACRTVFARPGATAEALWRHALCSAIACQALANLLKPAHKEEAFVAGLMHDVGKVVLYASNSERFERALAVERVQGIPSVDAERQIYAFSHTDVGALLVQKWRLPEPLEHAVFLHHDPELAVAAAEDHSELVWVTNIADRVAHYLGVGLAGPRDPALDEERFDALVAEPAVDMLELDPDRLADLVEQVQETYEREQQAFG